MRKIALLAFLLLLAFQTFAQEKATAVKVYTYIEKQRNYESLVPMAQDFLSRLKNEPPTTKGAVVIYYRYTWDGDCLDGRLKNDPETEHFLRKVIDVDTELDQSRLIYVQGLMQGRNEIEFWLVPSGAKTPEANYRDFDPPCCCPPLLVVGKPTVKGKIATLKFIAWMGESKSLATAKYDWTISQGKITSGQGTSHIEVDIKGITSSSVTASVEIEGLNPTCGCPTSTSYTTSIVR